MGLTDANDADRSKKKKEKLNLSFMLDDQKTQNDEQAWTRHRYIDQGGIDPLELTCFTKTT